MALLSPKRLNHKGDICRADIPLTCNPIKIYQKLFRAAYLCTRPEASPPASVSTSFLDTRLKSPGIVCFSAEAATPP